MSVYSSQSVAGGSVMSALFNGVLARTGYDQCASTALALPPRMPLCAM